MYISNKWFRQVRRALGQSITRSQGLQHHHLKAKVLWLTTYSIILHVVSHRISANFQWGLQWLELQWMFSTSNCKGWFQPLNLHCHTFLYCACTNITWLIELSVRAEPMVRWGGEFDCKVKFEQANSSEQAWVQVSKAASLTYTLKPVILATTLMRFLPKTIGAK